MSWSLGESGALALKATRGAGFDWGLAEEAAQAVVWLHARGRPGIAALCAYLESGARVEEGGVIASADAPTNASASPSGNPPANVKANAPSPTLCPITTGCALSDRLITLPTDEGTSVALGRVHTPRAARATAFAPPRSAGW